MNLIINLKKSFIFFQYYGFVFGERDRSVARGRDGRYGKGGSVLGFPTGVFGLAVRWISFRSIFFKFPVVKECYR